MFESYLGADRYMDVLTLYDSTRAVPGLPARTITFKGWAELQMADYEIERRTRWLKEAKATFDRAVAADSGSARAYVGRGMATLYLSGLDLSSPTSASKHADIEQSYSGPRAP